MTFRKTLKRDRIDRELENIFRYPLSVVEAPVGYGKTTAVRDFLSRKKCRLLWISLSSADSSPEYFWEKFSGAVSEADPECGERLFKLGFPIDAPRTADVLKTFSYVKTDKQTVLAIDDFHLLKNKGIGDFIVEAARSAPEKMHIAVVTRDTSDLDLAELMGKGLVYILPQKELLFTEDEVRRYCELAGFSPDEKALKTVCETTDGWISLVYLTLLGISRGVPASKTVAVRELIEKVLYRPLDDRIKKFLLKIAIFDSFDEREAECVSCEQRSAEYLRKLRKENAFVAYDEAAGTYKIHHMLIDFLRAEAGYKEFCADACRRAGEMKLRERDLKRAYAYFCKAGDATRILSLLEDPKNVSGDFAEFEGFVKMFQETPREILFKYPIAYLQYIILVIVYDLESFDSGIGRYEELKRYYEDIEGLPAEAKKRILGDIETIGVFTNFNDIEKMLECVRKGYNLLGGGRSSVLHRENEFTFGSPQLLYIYYRKKGSLKRIADIIRTEIGFFPLLTGGCGTGSDFVAQAEYALAVGDWKTAETSALKAVYKAGAAGQRGLVLCADFVLIRLYIYKGKITEAIDLLDASIKETAAENVAVYNTTAGLIEGYIYSCLGRYDKIPQWLRVGDMSPANFLFQGMAFSYIVYGKAVLLSGNHLKLTALSDVFAENFSVFNNRLGFIHNAIFKAIAEYNLNGKEAGVRVLGAAIREGEADRLIMPYVEYAADIIEPLKILASETTDGFADEIYGHAVKYLAALKNSRESPRSLTSREKEILRLSSRGLTRSEIATELFLSEGTVKKHFDNIFKKLEVGGKTAAIKRAEKMKLI
jgi:ATP-dependent transcriptional regulator